MFSKAGESEATGGRTGREELPERWSTRRKVEVVLRLLRGEDLGEVSRELQVSPVDLEEWRRVFLERHDRRSTRCGLEGWALRLGSRRSGVRRRRSRTRSW